MKNKKPLLLTVCVALAVLLTAGVLLSVLNISADVTVLDCDVNGDGIVNTKDIIRLCKYIKSPDVYGYDERADVNGDGVISYDDVSTLSPLLGKTLNIIEGGAANYSIVYSADASSEVVSSAYALSDGISDITGVQLTVSDDIEASESLHGYYIIIGDSLFEESSDARSSLSGSTSDEFTIRRMGTGNIVITASYDDHINDAVQYYVDTLIEPNYKQSARTLSFEGYDNAGVDMLPSGFKLSDLSRAKIIYATDLEGYVTVAQSLRDRIKSVYGIDVPIYADTEHPSSAYEILVGKTNRPVSVDSYAKKGYVMEYDVMAQYGSLQILCGGAFSARKASERLNSELFTSANASKTLSLGSYVSKSLLASSVALTSGTDARIMTLNIMPHTLGEAEYANILPVRERAEIFAGILVSVSPDVIGLQEACYQWQEQLPYYAELMGDMYGMDYRLVLTSYNGKNNYTPMLYRADKFDALECKFQHYDYHTSSANKNGVYLRGASQLVLQSRSNANDTFVVLNAHWDHGGQTTTANPQYMNECAKSEEAIVASYKEKYPNSRIFCIGDFNSHRYNNVFFDQFCEDINGTVASEAAKASGTLKTAGGYHAGNGEGILENETRSSCSPSTNAFIDHIVFTSKNTSTSPTVLRHDTLYGTGGYFHILSDHCAVYADINFN